MRHGNNNPSTCSGFNRDHSDPTYEAWKRMQARGYSRQIQYSDPTYEAWKPFKCFCQFSNPYCNSDPTYEAWKPPTEDVVVVAPLYSDPTYEAWKQHGASIFTTPIGEFRSYL